MGEIGISIGSAITGLSRTTRAVAIAVPLALSVAAASAQNVITDQPTRDLATSKQAQQAAEGSLDLRSTGDFEPVTYADVLKDPDNIELSFRFARTQIGSGDLHGAVTTLERILMVNPNLAQVRLFYAIVLFRLENLDESDREFRTIAALDIPTDVRAEVEAYLARIRYLRQRTRYTASLSLGVHYDTNIDATPESDSVLFIDIPIELDKGEEDDFGFLGIGGIRVDHDLGYQERHELFGALTYYHDEQVSEDTFDLQSFAVEAGGVYRRGPWGVTITPTAFFTHLELSRETFFKDYGLDLRFERNFGPRLIVFVGARISDRDFEGIAENTAAALRDGRRIEGMAGASYVMSPTMRVTGDYLRFDKNAKADFFGYDRDQVRLSHTWLLAGGQFLLTNFTYQRDRYDEADIFISGRTRHDDIYRVRATYGAPLGFLIGAGKIWRGLEDVTLSGSLEYLKSSSNIVNFDYENMRVQGLFTKTWRF